MPEERKKTNAFHVVLSKSSLLEGELNAWVIEKFACFKKINKNRSIIDSKKGCDVCFFFLIYHITCLSHEMAPTIYLEEFPDENIFMSFDVFIVSQHIIFIVPLSIRTFSRAWENFTLKLRLLIEIKVRSPYVARHILFEKWYSDQLKHMHYWEFGMSEAAKKKMCSREQKGKKSRNLIIFLVYRIKATETTVYLVFWKVRNYLNNLWDTKWLGFSHSLCEFIRW